MLFHNSSVCAWMQPFVEAARSKQLEQRRGMILSWPLDVQYSKEAEVMLITAYLWFYSGNSWSSCQKRPQILPWQYQCMLGSQLTVAQLQAPCIWFLPHTLPSTSLFLLIISSSDPKRNPGWKKSREILPLYSMFVAFPQSPGLSAVGFDMKGEGKKDGRNVVAALLPHSFPRAVCKVHRFVECSERSQACPWRAVLTKIPIFQMEGATSFPGQNTGRTKAKPHNLLCSIRGEIFPEGKIQSILCHFLTSHKSLQLCKDNSSFPIQLLN